MKPSIKIDVQATADHVGVATLSAALARFLRQNNFNNVILNVVNHVDASEVGMLADGIDGYLQSTESVIKDLTVEITALNKADVKSIKYERVECVPPVPTEEELAMPTVRPAYEGSPEYTSDEPVELRLEVGGGFRQSGRSVLIAVAADALKKAGFEDLTIKSPHPAIQARNTYGDLMEQARATPDRLRAAREKVLKNKVVLIDRS